MKKKNRQKKKPCKEKKMIKRTILQANPPRDLYNLWKYIKFTSRDAEKSEKEQWEEEYEKDNSK